MESCLIRRDQSNVSRKGSSMSRPMRPLRHTPAIHIGDIANWYGNGLSELESFDNPAQARRNLRNAIERCRHGRVILLQSAASATFTPRY
jgi:hypothetical protein